MQPQSPLVQPTYTTAHFGTPQISYMQPAATQGQDDGQAVPAPEPLQTTTYQAASTQGVPFTYHAAMPYGAPTVQTQSPVMYQHQYQPSYMMSPHSGLPTAQSMVAYPVGAGIPQP